jgi:tRNA 5-methylaminomethyl-2-thiouridine biosynthesis bifunctional protein
MSTLQPLIPAQLRWNEGTPEAELFGDIYFSRANGLEESRYVFLAGNALHERWKALQPKEYFVIGETGFGTGLNFLLAWQLWEATAPTDTQLFFISTELHPLTREDLQRALTHWPELAPYAEALLQHYPHLTPGFHWLPLVPGRITLLLLFGDANHTLAQLADCQHNDFFTKNPWHIDAWFLDGFAPAKNPTLWQNDLLHTIATLSKTGTTVATFTAAGQVRRDLQALGFHVKKIAGYGSKREMIVAAMTDASHPSTPKNFSTFKKETPWLLHNTTHAQPEHVIVIGAGLAGCHIARTLAERCIAVTVLEKHAAPAQEASGNAQGALYTKLSANDAALTRFSLASLQYALQHYQRDIFSDAVSTCGLLQLQEQPDTSLRTLLANNASLAQWIDAKAASECSGIALTRGGWWLQQSGWINPAMLCRVLLEHPLITVQYNTEITQQLSPQNNEHIVIACANQTAHFAQTQWMPLRPVRGQITHLPMTDTSNHLRCVICDEGYLTPAFQQQHCLGASFMPDDIDTQLRTSEQQHNLNLLRDIAPTLDALWCNADLAGRAALRCTTPDHLPMVGALPNREFFLQRYTKLQHNARAVIHDAGGYMKNVWIFTGFGGRGLCYIPLAAELLAAQILNTPRPLPRDLQQALAPARFLIKNIVRTHANKSS